MGKGHLAGVIAPEKAERSWKLVEQNLRCWAVVEETREVST